MTREQAFIQALINQREAALTALAQAQAQITVLQEQTVTAATTTAEAEIPNDE